MAAASLVVASLGARATPRVVASRRVARASSRARRAAAPVRASGERDDAPSEGSNDDDGNTSSLPLGLSRRNLIDAAFVAISIPLWRDIAHDLGYLQGPEDAPADLPKPPPGSGYRTATFAGGCFWCMERPFDELDGVIATTSGYTGGFKDQPTYHEVGGGSTGHRESVQILYDPSKVSYETLLNVFWRQIDPTRDDGMFLDSGFQYTSAIYVADETQRAAAEESVVRLTEEGRFPGAIKTPVEEAKTFWPAERYHQDYYRLNSTRYGFYRSLSGRDEFVQSVWGPEAMYGH
jgi:methionine-S-sulfoxide reductase